MLKRVRERAPKRHRDGPGWAPTCRVATKRPKAWPIRRARARRALLSVRAGEQAQSFLKHHAADRQSSKAFALLVRRRRE